MAILTVGQGRQFERIADAINAADAGDVVQIQAGTYVNDFATITRAITLEGVGGMAHLLATEAPPDGKAILTINADATIKNLEFSGAAVADRNGAGIRYQAGDLAIRDSYFHDNQNGLLATPLTPGQGNISIVRSEFSGNGAGDGQSHNVYVTNVANLEVDQSYFHGAVVGHEIKSRAARTTITNSRIENGPDGRGSYEIDLPNGGNALIRGNVIEQGPRGENPNMIAYGEEGGLQPGSTLRVEGNVFVNDRDSGSVRAVWNAAGLPTTIAGNTFYGLSPEQAVRGDGTVSGSTFVSTRPDTGGGAPFDPAPPAGADPEPQPPDAAPEPQPAPEPEPSAPAPDPAPNPRPDAPSGSTVTLSPQNDPPPAGSGAALVLRMSADAYKGDAQFRVSVDGQALGGTYTVSAQHADGDFQAFAFAGDWGPGRHEVGISFINDAWEPGVGDRNLYVDSVTLNGTLNGNSGAALYSNETKTLSVSTFQGPPSDRLVLRLSEEMFDSHAEFLVSVDGQTLGGPQTVTAAHGAGQTQAFTFKGQFGPGPHDVALTLLGGEGGGAPAALYVDGVELNNASYAAGNAIQVSSETTHLQLLNPMG